MRITRPSRSRSTADCCRAEDEARQRPPPWVGQQLAKFFGSADAHEAGRAHVDTEGVVWGKADVAFDGELHRVILGACE